MTSPTSGREMFRHLRNTVNPAFAVLVGVQLDLFTSLKNGPKTAEEIATELGVNANKLQALLYILVLAEFLTVDEGRFANSPDANKFLVCGESGLWRPASRSWNGMSCRTSGVSW